MGKTIWIILILIVCSNFAKAQISGVIYNEASKEPLWGAKISTSCISSGLGLSETDIDGCYSLRTFCRKGKIMISHRDYANQEIEYEIKSHKIDLHLDTIYLKEKPIFSNYTKSQISGFIYNEDYYKPMIGATIITYCETDTSGLSGATSDFDGSFNLSSSCKKGKIMISYIGYPNQEIEYEIKNDKIQLDTIFFKAPIITPYTRNKNDLKYNPDLAGKWEVVYFSVDKNKKYYLDEEDQGYFYLKFLEEDYDLNNYGSFFTMSGFTENIPLTFKLLENNKIEFRMTKPYIDDLLIKKDLYAEKINNDESSEFSSSREDNRLRFLYEFKSFTKLFWGSKFRYELKNNELFLSNGIDEILLKQSL